MNILMLYPKFPEQTFWNTARSVKLLWGRKAIMPPLGLLTIASYLPEDFSLRLIDRNVAAESDSDWAWADVVFLSVMMAQRDDYRECVANAKMRGKPIAVGGPFTHALPEDACADADWVCFGEAEDIMEQLVSDLRADRRGQRYQGGAGTNMERIKIPRFELLPDVNDYATMALQFSRGCPFKCEFCDIIVTYGRKVRAKPVAHVIAELQQWADHGVDFVTLADDNLVGDRAYCRQMLRAVADWNRARTVPISLYAEMSVDAVRDPELLELCRQANITEMFLGVETPRKAGLRETLKMQNVATDLVSAVKTIQSYGMVTVAGMILGFDTDDAAIFEDQYAFLQEAGIPIVMLGLLQAIPRTPLYERLERTGRLRSPTQGNNTLSFTNIEPICMPYDELVNGYRTLFTRLYTLDAIGERWLANVEAWRSVPGRRWLQKPLGRFRPFMLVQTLLILRWYVARPSRFAFLCRMIVGTLRKLPAAVPQTVSYLAYFIHLREYADKVVAREWKFNYALDEVNTSANQFGEGGAINMVKREAQEDVQIT